MNRWKSNLIFNDLHPLSRLKLENQLKVIVSSEDSAKHCFKYEWTLVDANFSAGPCLNDDLVADGFCDDDTNNLACNFDGGDCCGFEVLEDYCDDCDCLEGWDVDEGQKLLLFFLTDLLSYSQFKRYYFCLKKVQIR